MTEDLALKTRLREFESLCSDIYVAAVELGLPQPLLQRLWMMVGQGSAPAAFSFDLPPRSTPADTSAPESRPPDATAAAKPRAVAEPPKLPELRPLATRRTVMVVDDDPLMLEVLVRILQRENYELIAAGGGLEALDKRAQHAGDLDLLITDCEMPDLKGPEVAVQMRQRQPALKVLYQTGFSSMLFDSQMQLDDHSAFLEKPFSARGLREAARLLMFDALNP